MEQVIKTQTELDEKESELELDETPILSGYQSSEIQEQMLNDYIYKKCGLSKKELDERIEKAFEEDRRGETIPYDDAFKEKMKRLIEKVKNEKK